MTPANKHLPGISGGVEAVNGESIIDTGLRRIQSFVATINANNFVPNEESKLSWYILPKNLSPTVRVVLRIEKGGDNDGVLGDSEVQVSWIAVGE